MRLARITIYPIKALDGIRYDAARVLNAGPLKFDRRWALFDTEGSPINGKREARVHGLRLQGDPAARVFTFSVQGVSHRFHIDDDRAALEGWLSEYFTQPVTVAEDATHGFPDDLEASGPTIVSTATLECVASWFPGLELDEIRRRFRPNLEIDGVEPFWEDRLYGPPGEYVEFTIGSVRLAGTNPCRRCVVPTRSSLTGEVWSGFARQFAEKRSAMLPAWAARERFDHFYRLVTNTRIAQPEGGTIRVGDAVSL